MELEKRVADIETELKIVKGEIKELLVDIRDLVNKNENPFFNGQKMEFQGLKQREKGQKRRINYLLMKKKMIKIRKVSRNRSEPFLKMRFPKKIFHDRKLLQRKYRRLNLKFHPEKSIRLPLLNSCAGSIML